MDRRPLQFLMLAFAGWANRRQQEMIEYLQAENRVLREQLGGKRLRFTDVQRRRLARRAQQIGRRDLTQIATLVTPDTPTEIAGHPDTPRPPGGSVRRMDGKRSA